MLMTCAPVTLRSPVKWIKCFWFHFNQSKEANHHRVTTHDRSLHSCVNTRPNDEQCVYKYFYSGWFRPWTHRGWAPAAVARFSWCWRSERHGEEQAVETRQRNLDPLRQNLSRGRFSKVFLFSHRRNFEANRFSDSYLALQFHPAALLLGLQLLGLVLFDALQETVPALWVLHMLNTHVDPLGQDPAPVRVQSINMAILKIIIYPSSQVVLALDVKQWCCHCPWLFPH